MEELAREAALAGFAVVAAAGGDGTVHEVANGLLRAGRPETILAVLPLGSANDYAHSLGLDRKWWLRHDPQVTGRMVDVGVARSPGRQRFFVNGLGLGFNGWVTLESRRIHHLRGMLLYGLALLRALWYRHTAPSMAIRFDDEAERVVPTLALSLALGRREGNFVVAPDAQLDDGRFDFVHAGAMSRLRMLSFLPGLALGRLPAHPLIRRGTCRRVLLRSSEPLLVHLDGEFFCLPKDDVCELEVELLPGALRVLGKGPERL
jgi:diacylglycerol kinase family enzyme